MAILPQPYFCVYQLRIPIRYPFFLVFVGLLTMRLGAGYCDIALPSFASLLCLLGFPQ